MNNLSKILGGTLLVAGTTVGGAVLGLPVATASSGFVVALAAFFVVWAVMCYAGFLFLEVNLWLPDESNMVSMARATLGLGGQVVAWLSFLLLLMALMVAYITGGSSILVSILEHGYHYHLSSGLSSAILVAVVGTMVFVGAAWVDGINRFFIFGLVLAYVVLVTAVFPHIQPQRYHLVEPKYVWAAIPVITTSFGYHVVIPSLRTYLKSDVKALRLTLLLGSLLPLVAYLFWELVVIGAIPSQGQYGLLAMLASGNATSQLVDAIDALSNSDWVQVSAEAFVFFAISTSFLGVSLSLFDFLADGLHLPHSVWGKLLTTLLTFIPPVAIMHVYPQGFLAALGYAGIFVAVLLAILPAMMVWRGRYHLGFAGAYRAIGGRGALSVVIVLSLVAVFIEIANNLHLLPSAV